MFRSIHRPCQRAAGVLLGLSALLPFAGPASASATSATPPAAPATVAAAPAAPVPASAPAPAYVMHAMTQDIVLGNPYPAKDKLAAGWTVVHAPDSSMKLFCTGPSVAGRTANTYSCLPAASYAVACFQKTGYRDVVTCVVDPKAKKLVEYRTKAPLQKTGLAPVDIRRPVAATMSTGDYCRLTSSGVAVRPGEKVISWAACSGSAQTRLWQNPDGSDQYRIANGSVQYRAATEQKDSPVRWANVTTRYWIG